MRKHLYFQGSSFHQQTCLLIRRILSRAVCAVGNISMVGMVFCSYSLLLLFLSGSVAYSQDAVVEIGGFNAPLYVCGDSERLDVTVSNAGASALTSLELSIDVSAMTALPVVTPITSPGAAGPLGSFTTNASEILWSIPSLGPGMGGALQIDFAFIPIDLCGDLTATVSVVSSDQTDVDPSNDMATYLAPLTPRPPSIVSCMTDISVACPTDIPAPATNATEFLLGGGSLFNLLNCGGLSVVAISDTSDGACPETISRVYELTGVCGFPEQCTQTIVVANSGSFVSTCPPDITVGCPSAVPPAAMTAADFVAAGGSLSLACGSSTVTHLGDASPAGAICSYTIERSWMISSVCGGASVCTQLITVADITPPVITVPLGVTLPCTSGVSSFPTSTYGVATAVDACDPLVVIIHTDVTNVIGGFVNVTRTWTATDACGNSVASNQFFINVDNAAPTLVPPTNVTVACGSSTTPAFTGFASATDLCDSNPAVTYTDLPSAVCTNGAVLVRTWISTDASGNMSTATQLITFSVTPPSIMVNVALVPTKANVNGAGWRLVGSANTNWQASGATILVSPGNYSLEFMPAVGFNTPPPEPYTVTGPMAQFETRLYSRGYMVLIPGGTFLYGPNMGGLNCPVTLQGFAIDSSEVPVCDYQIFATATGRVMPAQPGTNLFDPVVNVTWDDATAYAAWTGKRLPTDAEWEYATRDGKTEETFSYGPMISPSDANYDWNVGNITQIKSYPISNYGLYDMGGNVWEWVADWYSIGLDCSPTNPLGAASGDTRVIRGGSYVSDEHFLRTDRRAFAVPTSGYTDVGFRTAITIDSTDSDADGIPDWQESIFFGGTGFADCTTDSDFDGINDCDEILNGLNPTQFTPVNCVTCIEPDVASSGQTICWTAKTGSTYTMEWTPLAGSPYTPIAMGLLGVTPISTYFDPVDRGVRGFYRTVLE